MPLWAAMCMLVYGAAVSKELYSEEFRMRFSYGIPA